MFKEIIRCTCVCCIYEKVTYVKVNRLRYDSFTQKYQGTLGQVLIAFCGIFYSLYSFSLSPTCRVSLETHVQRADYQAFISVSKGSKP